MTMPDKYWPVSVPDDSGNGRRYNQWAGNTRGWRERPSDCIAEVHWSQRSPLTAQCQRKRGKGPDGLFCGTHARMIAKVSR